MPETETKDLTFFVRVTPADAAEFDRLVAKERKKRPRDKVTRAVLLREAMWRMIDDAKAG
jgi:hypothetical protein